MRLDSRHAGSDDEEELHPRMRAIRRSNLRQRADGLESWSSEWICRRRRRFELNDGNDEFILPVKGYVDFVGQTAQTFSTR